jgi:hypothetical protein
MTFFRLPDEEQPRLEEITDAVVEENGLTSALGLNAYLAERAAREGKTQLAGYLVANQSKLHNAHSQSLERSRQLLPKESVIAIANQIVRAIMGEIEATAIPDAIRDDLTDRVVNAVLRTVSPEGQATVILPRIESEAIGDQQSAKPSHVMGKMQ